MEVSRASWQAGAGPQTTLATRLDVRRARQGRTSPVSELMLESELLHAIFEKLLLAGVNARRANAACWAVGTP